MAWRGSRSTLAGLAVLSIFLLASSQPTGEERNGEKPAGCVARANQRQQVCPRWKNGKYVHPDTNQDYDLDQQEMPCMSRRDMKDITDLSFQSLRFVNLYPGMHTACGHGNREFFFMARESFRGRAVPDKVIIAFMAGGWCWDAVSCGVANLEMRTMAKDSVADSAGPAPSPLHAYSRNDMFVSGIFEQESAAVNNKFGDYALVVVPDCTGDMHMGNRSYTYAPDDQTRCITAHHKGAENAGAAVDWLIRNFPTAKSVLVVGTGHSESSKANGAHGAAVWAPYIQERLPAAVVRTVIDSSMATLGPDFGMHFRDDPWGTQRAMTPSRTHLLPDPEHWHMSTDEWSTLIELMAVRSPSVAYADVSSVDDALQINDYIVTGGKAKDCCLNGCGCDFGTDFGVSAGAPAAGHIGGHLDWTKSRKVQVLRRLRRLPNHYRSWLHSGARKNWLVTGVFKTECPIASDCPPEARLVNWLYAFATGRTTFNADGSLDEAMLPPMGGGYEDRAFGKLTCAGCLSGVLGSSSMADEACNATLGDGETLYTVAPKFGSDWMALWSLNGQDDPDVSGTGDLYRFGHEYEVRTGETMVEIAKRFGTTVEALLRINFNVITHIMNPERLKNGDKLCIVPNWHRTMDQMGQTICAPDGGMEGTGAAMPM